MVPLPSWADLWDDERDWLSTLVASLLAAAGHLPRVPGRVIGDRRSFTRFGNEPNPTATSRCSLVGTLM